jgi:hypothetical protein
MAHERSILGSPWWLAESESHVLVVSTLHPTTEHGVLRVNLPDGLAAQLVQFRDGGVQIVNGEEHFE